MPEPRKRSPGDLAGGYAGVLSQSRLPNALIGRLVGVLVIAIGARYLVPARRN